MRKLLFIALALILLASCAPQSIYNWHNYDNAVYAYTKTNDEKSLEDLLKEYDRIIKNPGTSNRPAPGVCADYGYLLLKKGEKQKGIDLLKLEVSYYPESAQFINLIIKRAEK